MYLGAIVKNINVLEDCATLLAVSPDALATALTQKTRIVASTLCADFLNVSQSGEARDQFAITIYQLLVKRIVDDLNRRHTASPKMADKRKELRSIAIFDFGGLEDTGAHDGDTTGARNRFWQFASNFADELVLGWLKERLFADPVAKSSSPEFVSLFDGIKEEALDVSRCTAALFTHPQRGIIRAIDQDTLLLKQSFCTPQQSLDLNDHIGHLFPVRKQSMLAFGAAANRPPHGQAFAHDFRLMERFQHGHTRSSFGVRHYGGVSLRDKDKDARTVKVFYDVGDFMDANRQQHTQIPTYNSVGELR